MCSPNLSQLEDNTTSGDNEGRLKKRMKPNPETEPLSPSETYQQGETEHRSLWRAAGMRTPSPDTDFDNSNPFNDDPLPLVLQLPRKNGVDIGLPPRPEYSWKLEGQEVSTFFQNCKHRALQISTIGTGLQIES